MSKLIATLVATLFAATAFAQTNATPPTQPAAGVNTKMEAKDGKPDASKSQRPAMADMSAPMATDKKPMTRAAKRAARKEKRIEKVGDKPLN